LNGAGNLTGLRALNRASILVVVAGYLFMAWALAYHRIFNARQVLSTLAHRGLVLAALVGSTWGLSHLLQTLLPETAAWVGSTVACGLGAIWLNERTRPLLGLDHERSLAELRGEIIRLSQGAGDADQLRRQCEATVSRHFRVEQATILSLQGGHFAGEGIRIPRDRAGFGALLTLGWITPESLQRRRPSAAHQDLAAILAANRLSAAVAIPRGSPDPSVIIALGTRANNWPVTYPEITRLQNVAELIDGILTRTRLTDQIALQNRLEHLAMMSRALAHDLKNLITPVNAFLVHTEDRFPAGSEAAQVHSPRAAPSAPSPTMCARLCSSPKTCVPARNQSISRSCSPECATPPPNARKNSGSTSPRMSRADPRSVAMQSSSNACSSTS